MKKIILILILLQLTSFAGRMYDPDQGRFISRDVLGYVDGMGLYNGYFAESFGLDPMGTVKWQGGKRNGGKRTGVIMEKGDTITDVAKHIGLDPEDFIQWMTKKALDTRMCSTIRCNLLLRNWSILEKNACGDHLFYVPNTVLITIGNDRDVDNTEIAAPSREMFQLQDDLVNGTHTYLAGVGSGYHAEVVYAKDLKTIRTLLSNKDLVGWAHAGHGKYVKGKGYSGYYTGEIRLRDRTVVGPSDLVKRLNHKLGFIVMFSCGGANTNWYKMVMKGGRVWASDCKSNDSFSNNDYHNMPLMVRPVPKARKATK